jgi:hypothetical protein
MWTKPLSLMLPASFALGSLTAVEAYCEVYMNDQTAVATIFPHLVFKKSSVTLTSDERKTIEGLVNDDFRGNTLIMWRSDSGERVFIDQVLGKHEFITYAVGIDAQGAVKGIEILEYRESYGQKVRDESWRTQFVGKDVHSTVQINKDITNISGATLSSVHITKGVRRLIQTYDLVKNRT